MDCVAIIRAVKTCDIVAVFFATEFVNRPARIATTEPLERSDGRSHFSTCQNSQLHRHCWAQSFSSARIPARRGLSMTSLKDAQFDEWLIDRISEKMSRWWQRTWTGDMGCFCQ